MAELLTGETILDLTTVARVNRLRGLVGYNSGVPNGLAADYDEILDLIKARSRDARFNIMKRCIQKKATAWTERLDVPGYLRDGFYEFYLRASPVSIPTGISTDLAIYNNGNSPRVFTASADKVNSSYIICNPDMAAQGRVRITIGLISGPDCLQVAYKGGMASETAVNGINGVVALGTSTVIMTAAGQTFLTKGIAAGDVLALTGSGATDHGLWRISAVAETALTISAKISSKTTVSAFTASATGLEYEVMSGGNDTLVGLYPHVCRAVEDQIIYELNQKNKAGVTSQTIAGGGVTYERTWRGWKYSVLDVLRGEAREI